MVFGKIKNHNIFFSKWKNLIAFRKKLNFRIFFSHVSLRKRENPIIERQCLIRIPLNNN